MPKNGIVILLLILTTITALGGIIRNGFVNIDDQLYVYQNPHVQAGLTARSIWWDLTTMHASNWHPLTWFTLQLEYEIFGLNPAGYHLTSLVIHTLSVVLLFLSLERMTGAVFRSAMVAALFAIHPLRVESVAWISETKDVLCTFFWMVGLAAYVLYAEQPGVLRYSGVVLAMALGLLAKPMIVTLPCVLLLLDYWPLKRVPWVIRAELVPDDVSAARVPVMSRASACLLAEKLPLFVLVGASSITTLIAQKNAIAVLTTNTPRQFWVLNAVVSYVRYMGKMLWPRDLAVHYPHPLQTLPHWQAIAAGALLVGISVVVYYGARRWPYLAVGWLWYLGTLVPVIGLVQVGDQSMADRYTYVPLIGLFLMLTWGIADLTSGWRHRIPVLSLTAGLLLLICMICTTTQVQYWQDWKTLWEHSLRVDTDNIRAHLDLGIARRAAGNEAEAVKHFSEIRRIDPAYAESRVRQGGLVLKHGNVKAALQHFIAAAQVNPELAEAHEQLGLAFERLGNWEEARICNQNLVRLDPENAKYRRELAYILNALGQREAAREQYRQSLRLDPHWPQAAIETAQSLASHPDPRMCDGARATKLAEQACQATDQRQPAYLAALAAIYAEEERIDDAVRAAQKALDADAEAHSDQTARL